MTLCVSFHLQTSCLLYTSTTKAEGSDGHAKVHLYIARLKLSREAAVQHINMMTDCALCIM